MLPVYLCFGQRGQGGIAVVVVEALEVEQMRASDSALREGLLYDMLGRIQDGSPRLPMTPADDQTTQALVEEMSRLGML